MMAEQQQQQEEEASSTTTTITTTTTINHTIIYEFNNDPNNYIQQVYKLFQTLIVIYLTKFLVIKQGLIEVKSLEFKISFYKLMN